ncbi:hypothetical protein AWB69_06638 [Caballeronia udeis]|uniref:OmpA family protein n=1 Tax=Caballeronia udeis TaxID=1232866 RepID=A0A158ITP3_9BURK|nr:hypothetical protein [Caballeronia udeis]SAL59947.1 hypothetical protein AWB69_06638 [Caballeronia udeis]
MKLKYFVLALSLTAFQAFACVASENIDLYFAQNSAQLPNSEIVRLAHWVADQKVTYERHQSEEATALSGHADSTERDASATARARMLLGEQLLVNMGFTKAPIHTSTRVYNKGDVENGRRIEISFEPQCPNKCCNAPTRDATKR